MENCPLHEAAPELLEALKELIELLPAEQTKTWHKAKAAIEKAEGGVYEQI